MLNILKKLTKFYGKTLNPHNVPINSNKKPIYANYTEKENFNEVENYHKMKEYNNAIYRPTSSKE